MPRSRILVVDDDAFTAGLIRDWLAPDHDVLVADSVESALEELERDVPDVLVTDVRMPGGGGPAIVRRAAHLLHSMAVVVVSGEGTVADFTELLRLGVVDCLLKPLTESDLRHAVARAQELKRLRAENERLRAALEAPHPENFLEGGPAMQAVRDQVLRVAPTDATVLVSGSSGTGKEIVARALHELSPRAGGPFVVVSCGALVETLLESELFGHVKGAFTGADVDRAGCFEAAHRGTLFLDEVGSMSTALQVRLLRVLASREVTRVGDRRARPVDVRIVSATNTPLEELVAADRFRSDLFYRLNVVAVRLPDLRDRGAADIRNLANRFCAAACERFGRPRKELTEAALRRLAAHSWPGNVRELENIVGRAVILTGDAVLIDADALAFRSMPSGSDERSALPPEGLDLPAYLRSLERDLIRQALRRTAGNKQDAARLLGIKRTALVQKIARMGSGGSSGAGGVALGDGP